MGVVNSSRQTPAPPNTLPRAHAVQIGFLEIVCIPLFQSFTSVFTTAKPIFTYLMRNYEYWAFRDKRKTLLPM